MQKECSHCFRPFVSRAEDRQFLNDVSPVIAGKKLLFPLPKFCPSCREQRRLAYRNERVLYRRKSDLTKSEMISFFHPDSPFTVYTKDEWWSDSWDPMHFGRDYDFSRPFFEQFYELALKVPRPPLVNNKSENAEYCNFADGNKNSYLLTSADDNEDCYYGDLMAKNKNCVDATWIFDSELLYECIECHHCYNLRFSWNSENCSDSSFLLNCKGVKNSLFCINMRSKEYYLFNKQSSREEYMRKMKELAGSFAKYQSALTEFEKLKATYPIRKANNNVNCENAVGDNIVNSKNVFMGFDVYDSRDIAYSMEGLRGSDCHDIGYFDKTQWCYEGNSLIGYGLRFTNFCKNSSDLLYCDNCHNSKNCFGCVGLKNREYCIFNKQYSKAEYEELTPRIAKSMESRGEWGEFFPMRFSLFPYNETVAQEFYPLTKEEALKQHIPWRDAHGTEFQKQTVILPDNINETAPLARICSEIFTCSETGKNFRIIQQELEFYQRMQLPLPRKCPDARHEARRRLRNPRILFRRPCAKCRAEIDTVYAPDRPETVYCEKCYLDTVY